MFYAEHQPRKPKIKNMLRSLVCLADQLTAPTAQFLLNARSSQECRFQARAPLLLSSVYWQLRGETDEVALTILLHV
jgi:hypothetical protein